MLDSKDNRLGTWKVWRQKSLNDKTFCGLRGCLYPFTWPWKFSAWRWTHNAKSDYETPPLELIKGHLLESNKGEWKISSNKGNINKELVVLHMLFHWANTRISPLSSVQLYLLWSESSHQLSSALLSFEL